MTVSGEEVESARAKRVFNGSMSVRVIAAAATHRAYAATAGRSEFADTLLCWLRLRKHYAPGGDGRASAQLGIRCSQGGRLLIHLATLA